MNDNVLESNYKINESSYSFLSRFSCYSALKLYTYKLHFFIMKW